MERTLTAEEKEKRKFVLRTLDGRSVRVEEAMAFEIPDVKRRIILRRKHRGGKETMKTAFNIEGITANNLLWVVNYLANRVHPSQYPFDFDAEFDKLDPVSILNLVQAAHFLNVKSLMELTCKRLAYKVRNEIRVIMKEFNIEHKCAHHSKRLKRTEDMSPGQRGQQYSDKDCSPYENRILRNRRIETFINESDFVDVHVSRFVTNELCYVNRWAERVKSTFNEYFWAVMKSANAEQLSNAIRQLENVIEKDPIFALCLRDDVVRYLVQILDNAACVKNIQYNIVSILSHARFNICGDVIEKEVVPFLVKSVSDTNVVLSNSALLALTRLAYAFPDRIKVIVDENAFEAARKAFANARGGSIDYLAKFFAAVCRGYSLSSDGLPSDKVETVLTILEKLFQTNWYSYGTNHVVACYTLLYLSHGRSVELETETWNRLIKRLIKFICIMNALIPHNEFRRVGYSMRTRALRPMIADSALGVVGNFVRWGKSEQIQSLIKEHRLLQCLGTLLCSKFKKLQKEGCRIISNLAARSETSKVDMVETEVAEHLCELLENEESDVKLEAAWAVYNGIYGYSDYGKIDKYPERVI